VATLLGTQRAEDFADGEREHPDCLLAIWPRVQDSRRPPVPLYLDPPTVKQVVKTTWMGKANRLSHEHGVHWDIIDTAAEATWKTQADEVTIELAPPQISSDGSALDGHVSAGQLIRQRRSAVAFDAATSLSAATFFHMLNRVMPRVELAQMARPMPWDCWPYGPAVHLMLFVHRIDGLPPGLYFLVRDPTKVALLQGAMNAELTWQLAPGCPEDLPLYWLLEGDARKLAVQVSCHQDIAGDSAFSLGMVAEFEGVLRGRGAWWYPRLFWESGLLGQVLYLEAEAAGVRATGIGCFFDDPVHEIVAVKGLSLQSLYHFTIGGPVEDRRLMTFPPYRHLKRHG
jgi:hypothetical protein